MTIRTFALLAVGLLVLGPACADYRIASSSDGAVQGGGSGGGGGGGGGDVGDGGTGGGFIYEYDAGFVECVDIGRKVTLSPLDLFLLLDTSGSMDYEFKFPAVSSAIRSFTSNTQFTGIGVGLQYFPLRAACRTDVYSVPAVPIDVLPGNASSISISLAEQQVGGGTPMVSALTGALAYTKAHLSTFQGAGSSHKAVVVLATDGVPDSSCSNGTDGGVAPNTIANVEEVARNGLLSSPSVKTFVVGVGKELSVLDGIAAAGGTDKAVLVDVAANADVQFLNALLQIRKDALGCDFPVPAVLAPLTDGGTVILDTSRASVAFIPDDGSGVVVAPQVGDAASCGTANGWYFSSKPASLDAGTDAGLSDGGTSDGGVVDAGVPDAGDAIDEPKVVLCPNTCDVVTSGRTGTLKVIFPCGIQ